LSEYGSVDSCFCRRRRRLAAVASVETCVSKKEFAESNSDPPSKNPNTGPKKNDLGGESMYIEPKLLCK
jgi:hypothetical protein